VQQNEQERQNQVLALALQTEQDKFDAPRSLTRTSSQALLEAREHDQHTRLSQKQDEATLVLYSSSSSSTHTHTNTRTHAHARARSLSGPAATF